MFLYCFNLKNKLQIHLVIGNIDFDLRFALQFIQLVTISHLFPLKVVKNDDVKHNFKVAGSATSLLDCDVIIQ